MRLSDCEWYNHRNWRNHGYEIEITNETTSEIVLTEDFHTHATLYSINSKWTNDVTVLSSMKTTITVELDDNGNTMTKEINFVCKN